jgi:2-polyprenyl-3-methyl-5-hydroxy-6-metoxy-1,4-benzoquinol methylase
MPLARRCPICTFTRARPVWHEQALRYVRCSRCGVIYSDVDALTYATAGRNDWHEEELDIDTRAFYGSARELAHERFLTRFFASRTSRLLDIGCGLGYFMARAAARGWIAYGCDTSEQWLRHAAAVTGHPERLACSEPTAGLHGGNFELITIWDVLEHVHEPLPFLRAAADLLAPGGRLFIRTPNIAWVYPTYAARRHLLGADVTLGPLNHVVYYSAGTLRRALAAAGLSAIAWPVLPPPQVAIGNRRPELAGRRTATTLLKNVHAAAAERTARITRGQVVLGADLDVVTERA